MSGIYAILSNHGFGHLSRSASILSEFQTMRPELALAVASMHPPGIVHGLFQPGIELRRVALDTGVASSDILSFDPAATLQRIQALHAEADELVRTEAAFVRERGLRLIVSDIAPLATRVAREAGVPCWMWGNFGWDEIYRDWGGALVHEADRAAELYSACDRLFRLPMHLPMAAFGHTIDVGVTGRPTSRAAAEVRAHLPLDQRPIVLLAFGGLGQANLPFENAGRLEEFQFVSFSADAPALPNLHRAAHTPLQPRDLLPLCDRVLSKPGYGMFCEVLQQPAPFFCLEREGWAETPILLEALRDYYRHRSVTSDEFFGPDWNFLRDTPRPPRGQAPALDGNDVILRHLNEYFA